jgi:hypothetical protein
MCSAAMTRIMTKRRVVMPDDFDNFASLDPIKQYTKPAKIIRRDKEINTVSLECEQHMMQGVGAAAGALINTSFYLGMKVVMKKVYTCVKDVHFYTTSDDTIQITLIKNNVNFASARNELIEMPVSFLKHSMMLNSSKKQVDSTAFGEFNNKITFKTGMATVAPIYAALNSQPLNQPSPLADLMLAISSARSGVFWGISIDACQTALLMNLVNWRIKWLVESSDFMRLLNLRMIPLTAAEMIEGFFPRNKAGVGACWNAIVPELQPKILSGEMSLTHGLSSLRIYQNEKVHERLNTKSSIVVDTILESIEASRLNSGKISTKYVKIKSVATRRKFTAKLMSALENTDLTDEMYEKLTKIHRPPRAKVVFRVVSARTARPQQMGMSTRIQPGSMTRVLCMRYFNCQYRSPLSSSELAQVALSEPEFREWYQLN